MSTNEPGLSLRDYIETRFTLLITDINSKLAGQHDALINFMGNVKESLSATDLRYQQRFEAQSEALSAAFSAQQTAMKTALDAARDAVQAALAAADRAVSKTEVAADKRFESLGELINQRFDTADAKMVVMDNRMGKLETRVNVFTGESTGVQRVNTDLKSLWAVLIAAAAVLIEIAAAWLRK